MAPFDDFIVRDAVDDLARGMYFISLFEKRSLSRDYCATIPLCLIVGSCSRVDLSSKIIYCNINIS